MPFTRNDNNSYRTKAVFYESFPPSLPFTKNISEHGILKCLRIEHFKLDYRYGCHFLILIQTLRVLIITARMLSVLLAPLFFTERTAVHKK